MKKNYIVPSTEVHSITSFSIISTSSIEMTNSETAGQSIEVESREDNAISNIWDSEW